MIAQKRVVLVALSKGAPEINGGWGVVWWGGVWWGGGGGITKLLIAMD